MPPKCPSWGALQQFAATPFGDYFAVIHCELCGVVVGAVENNAIYPRLEEIAQGLQTVLLDI